MSSDSSDMCRSGMNDDLIIFDKFTQTRNIKPQIVSDQVEICSFHKVFITNNHYTSSESICTCVKDMYHPPLYSSFTNEQHRNKKKLLNPVRFEHPPLDHGCSVMTTRLQRLTHVRARLSGPKSIRV